MATQTTPAIDPAFAATLVQAIPATVEALAAHTALVDCRGNLVPITGDVSESSVMPGMLAVETDLGTLYLDEDETVTVPSVHAIPLRKPVSPARLRKVYSTPGKDRDLRHVTVSVLVDVEDLMAEDADIEIQRLIVGNEWFGSLDDVGFAVTGHRDGKAIVTVVADATDLFGETLCTNFDECEGLIDDGEGWDGECGNCADKTYAAEHDEDEDED
jgi:hypothetical protein